LREMKFFLKIWDFYSTIWTVVMKQKWVTPRRLLRLILQQVVILRNSALH
jgi:hypothetical protein